MKRKSNSIIRDDLSEQGRSLLRLLLEVLAGPTFNLGDPLTYIGYRDCCDRLGLIKPGMDIPWGRMLQLNGLNNLNESIMRHWLPAVCGFIVYVSGDRVWYRGGDYFRSHGCQNPDFDWWKSEVAKAVAVIWKP